MLRTLASAVASLALLVCAGSLAVAGGFAVTTLDELPASFEPGRPYDIGYTIRQHGVTPVAVESTEIRITSRESGKRISYPGKADGAVGHYVARVTFPAAGEWAWDVTQGWFAPHGLGIVTVGAVVTAAGEPAVTAPSLANASAAQPITIPGAAPTNGLVIAGVLLALAGAAVLLGSQLATTARTVRA